MQAILRTLVACLRGGTATPTSICSEDICETYMLLLSHPAHSMCQAVDTQRADPRISGRRYCRMPYMVHYAVRYIRVTSADGPKDGTAHPKFAPQEPGYEGLIGHQQISRIRLGQVLSFTTRDRS